MFATYAMATAKHALTRTITIAVRVPTASTSGKVVERDAATIAAKVSILQEELKANLSSPMSATQTGPAFHAMLVANSVPTL